MLPSDEFRILFVCSGNVCRSVLAERLTRHGIRARLGNGAGPDAGFGVVSAGTASRDGWPMHPLTKHALAGFGADTEGFRSHRLTETDVAAADLILSACAEHRDQVLALCPRASRRSYLLREFARLAAEMPSPDYPSARKARAAVAAAAQLRGRVPYVEPAADDIEDPAAVPEAFLACARQIDGTIRPVLDALCGTLSP